MLELDLGRVVIDLVASELGAARRQSVLAGPLASVTAATALGPEGLGADSLELLQCAGAVNEQFHLHETGVSDYLLQHRTLGAWAEIVRASWQASPERLTFRTSGSTGGPKPCVHRWTDLEAEIRDHAVHFAGTTRIVGFVPSHHIYGFLFTIGLPAALSVPVLDGRRLGAGALRDTLRAGDLLVGTPTLYRYLLQSLRDFPAGVRGVSSTAPCPPELRHELAARGLPLTEIYGSSETAGIGRCVDASATFTLLPAWDFAGDELRRRSDGTTVMPPDALLRLDERSFRVSGRHDGAVPVGGVNVFPARVADRIRGHPLVADCAVRLMRPHEGERLKAFLVLQPGADPSVAAPELERWLRETCTTPERPAVLTFGTTLPRGELGKPADWDLGPAAADALPRPPAAN